MSARVLSTETAKTTIERMGAVINGTLLDEIVKLQGYGRTLSDPEVWDGQRAIQFRGDWQQMESQLNQTQATLEQLRTQWQQINVAIMTAGGNA